MLIELATTVIYLLNCDQIIKHICRRRLNRCMETIASCNGAEGKLIYNNGYDTKYIYMHEYPNWFFFRDYSSHLFSNIYRWVENSLWNEKNSLILTFIYQCSSKGVWTGLSTPPDITHSDFPYQNVKYIASK
jgi:hypothetical protein